MIEKPTARELINRINSSISSRIFKRETPFEKGVVYVLSNVIGLAIHSLYEYADREGRTPIDATGELLEAFGESCGLLRYTPTKAYGYVNVEGTGIIKKGSVITRCDGVKYKVVEETQAPNPVLIRAFEVGSIANAPAKTAMKLSSSVTGVKSDMLVAEGGIVGGSDLETDDEFRERVISCYRAKCVIGTKYDYELWAKLYPGVTRVFVQPKPYGPGTVAIFFTMDSTYPDGIPLPSDVDKVKEIIEENAPAHVYIEVSSPKIRYIDLDIELEYSNQETRNLITESIRSKFKTFSKTRFCETDVILAINEVYNGCFNIKNMKGFIDKGVDEVLGLGQINYYSMV